MRGPLNRGALKNPMNVSMPLLPIAHVPLVYASSIEYKAGAPYMTNQLLRHKIAVQYMTAHPLRRPT